MTSKSASDGSSTIEVTFEVGTDVDMANVIVQNRVSEAERPRERRSHSADPASGSRSKVLVRSRRSSSLSRGLKWRRGSRMSSVSK